LGHILQKTDFKAEGKPGIFQPAGIKFGQFVMRRFYKGDTPGNRNVPGIKKIVYYAGNPEEERDRLPKGLIENLRRNFPELEFVHFDPTESGEFPDKPVLIDTVHGIDKVTLFEGLEAFARSPGNSVHDYDLPLELRLLLKLKKIKGVTIIGIPPGHQAQKAAAETGILLRGI
jgi:hypothetical protein